MKIGIGLRATACPTERACSGGVVLSAVDLSGPCGAVTGGTMTLSIREQTTSAEWGPQIPVSTPGYGTGAMTWTVVSATPVDATCTLTAAMLSIHNYTGYGDEGGVGRRAVVDRGGGEVEQMSLRSSGRGSHVSHLPLLLPHRSPPPPGVFYVGTTPLDYPTCPNGFSVTFQAARSNNAGLFAQCTAAVTVLQVLRRCLGTLCLRD